MTDPKNTTPPPTVEPHPASGHRTPHDIAKDEAGPGGPTGEGTPDNFTAAPPKGPTVEQKHIRAAVQRSARASEEEAERHPGGKLPRHSDGHSRKS